MKKSACRFCGAGLTDSDENCPACGAPLPPSSKLSGDDIKKISSFALAMERALKAAKKKADTKIALSFIILALAWAVASYTVYTAMKDDMMFAIAAILTSGFILFIIFGFFVGWFEQRAMNEIFEKKLKADIDEYLKLTGYTNNDFRIAAGEALTEEAELNSYI